MNTRSIVNRSACAMLCSLTAAIVSGCAASPWKIDNPYADVDWRRYLQVKANFHTHTTQSDGRMSPAEAVDAYRALGYGALALTDHNKVTWPWHLHGHGAEHPEMVAVQGSEASLHHHVGTYFCDVPGALSETGTLAKVRQQGGVAVVFHPGRYAWSAARYAALYREWDELVGMEVLNQGDRYPRDRETWDEVLAVLMSEGRPVWGFSNDDMHQDSHLGRNWNVLLLPDLSGEAVRRAMEKGAFLFVYAPKGHKGTMPPTVSAIKVDRRKGVVRIEATDYERMEWISGGEVVHHGEMIDLAATPHVSGYIRAVIYAADDRSLTGTQPMRIQPRDE